MIDIVQFTIMNSILAGLIGMLWSRTRWLQMELDEYL